MEVARKRYFLLRRCTRVRFRSLRCFFLRIRLRRFLMSDPMRLVRLPGGRRCATFPLTSSAPSQVVQLAERRTLNPVVVGSIPTLGASKESRSSSGTSPFPASPFGTTSRPQAPEWPVRWNRPPTGRSERPSDGLVQGRAQMPWTSIGRVGPSSRSTRLTATAWGERNCALLRLSARVEWGHPPSPVLGPERIRVSSSDLHLPGVPLGDMIDVCQKGDFSETCEGVDVSP